MSVMAPEIVPGVLLTNRIVRAGAHRLEDLTAEILKQYGIAPEQGQRGAPVGAEDRQRALEAVGRVFDPPRVEVAREILVGVVSSRPPIVGLRDFPGCARWFVVHAPTIWMSLVWRTIERRRRDPLPAEG